MKNKAYLLTLVLPTMLLGARMVPARVVKIGLAKKMFDFDKLPGKKGSIRDASGLDLNRLSSLRTSVISVSGAQPDMKLGYGLARTFVVRSKESKEQTAAAARIDVHVAPSPIAAQEMLFEEFTQEKGTMPLNAYLLLLKLTKNGPGDFCIVHEGKESIYVWFARNNIWVRLERYSGQLDMLVIAREIDGMIRKLPIVPKSEYDKRFAMLSVARVIPDAPVVDEKVTILVKIDGKIGKGQVLRAIGEFCTPAGYDAEKMAFSVIPRLPGRWRVGIAVYDPRSLLSRWTVAEIVVGTPSTKEGDSRPSSESRKTEPSVVPTEGGRPATDLGAPSKQEKSKTIQGGAQVNQNKNWTWLVGTAVAGTVLVIAIILLLRRTRRRGAGANMGK